MLFGVLYCGLIACAGSREPLPLPMPSAPAQNAAPHVGADEPSDPAHALRDGPPREPPRSNWRNLSPAQRDAIRRLSQEEREALIHRGRGRQGGAVGPGSRLSPQERRHLRDQIREEHERRGGGWGRRP